MKSNILSMLMLASIICNAQQVIKVSDSLSLKQISERCFMHISLHHVPGFGQVSSNGLVYLNNNEVLIMDTPPNEKLSRDLLEWLTKNHPSAKVVGVVVNHFHSDCLGGLKIFHEKSIPSYGYWMGPMLLKEKNQSYDAPQNLFKKNLVLDVGGSKVRSEFPGEAHTRDNIVTYVESDHVLFGGCMVKTLNATKGNIADANIGSWSNTVSRVKKKFKKAAIIVPGHGVEGGTNLLDYTVSLFAK